MMTRDNIIALPDPRLRQKSKRIHVLTDEVRKLAADMQAATLDWEQTRPHELGVALAAVQVGALERVVVIRNNFDSKDDKRFIVLINPEIVKLEGEVEMTHEGCLSVPDIYGLVPRHNKIRVKALNEDGEEIRVKAEGFLAVVIQHEIDHTHGVMFVDHIKDKDAFFRLTDKDQLVKLKHADVLKNNILWQ